jgi:hypothetical protein
MDKTRILSWSGDGVEGTGDAKMWNAETDAELAHFSHEDAVNGAAWNADETRILTWSDDNTARVWDAETGDELARLNHEDAVNGAAWNADETRILTWSVDSTVQVRLAPGELLREHACAFALHNLTWLEWQQYLPNRPYEKTCPDLPPHPSAVEAGVVE